jgi:hypothetical protein
MMKISLKIKSLMASVAVSAAVALGSLSAQAANETLKIGFVGVTSGPAAKWPLPAFAVGMVSPDPSASVSSPTVAAGLAVCEPHPPQKIRHKKSATGKPEPGAVRPG